jgi:hypothetical protein
MAGFIERNSSGNGTIGGFNVSKGLRKLASLGMDYDDMVIRQSQAIGTTEAMVGNQGFMPEDFLYSLAMADIGHKKYIGYFDKQLKQKREYLKTFAMNGEIDFILETIADESIVYDSKNFFCRLDLTNLRKIINEDRKDEIISYAYDAFTKIYYAHHFVEGYDAWQYFKQFLIDGFLAFEIIWNKDATEIIGFKELDALSLRPGVVKETDGKLKKIWMQYEDIPSMKRELLDSQVIYISYAKSNFVSRTSYIERLIRSFNLLRILENSRIIWNVMNASFRIKMIVPIGTKSPQKAKESLAEMMSIYKEDIQLDQQSGELSVNGRPSMQFYKNYLFPSSANNGAPEIDVMQTAGTDLSDNNIIDYFGNKLIKDSKVPAERFQSDQGGGQWSMSADGMSREEIRFSKFITRLRSVFQELILKPVVLQIQRKYPEVQDDVLFKASIGLAYEEENVFKELKEMEIMDKRANFVTSMLGLMVAEMDDTGMPTEVPFFDALFLTEKYLKMNQGDLDKNQLYVNRRKRGEDPRTGKKIEKPKPDSGDGGLPPLDI